ncbi:MAG: energy-coupling factor transporter transmembrane protein EcfT, partial [Chloroflexi bacterium]
MEDFELLRNLTIGQYLPGESLIHRLDPRTKLSIFLFIT